LAENNGRYLHLLSTGDIRNQEDCTKAFEGGDYLPPKAALDSVVRSVNEITTTNVAKITLFLLRETLINSA